MNESSKVHSITRAEKVYAIKGLQPPTQRTPWYISPMILDVAINQISPDTAVVTLSGALTLGTSLMTADNKLQGLIKAGTIKIALDMSGVPYIDSAGLGAIVHAYGLAMEMQGTMRLCGISPKVESLLKMTRMDTFLPIDPDVATSLAALA
jgi:anti-anti-sigma factor